MKHRPVRQGQTITPGTTCPTLFDECVGSLTSPVNLLTPPVNTEDVGDRAYGLYPLSEKTLMYNHSPQ